MSNLNDDELMKAAMGDLDDISPEPKPVKQSAPHQKTVPSKFQAAPYVPKNAVQSTKSKAKQIAPKSLALTLIVLVVMASATLAGIMLHSNADSNNNTSDNNYDAVFSNGDEAQYYEASSLSVGDYFELGQYPQTQVTDVRLLADLEEQDVNMTSYTIDDIAYNYGDFEYDGVKYRRVSWTRDSDYRGAADKFEKDINYYFIWEPILWDVIGEVDGEWQIFANKVLDGKPMDFNSNYWSDSECREWLSSTFMADAFDDYDQSIIEITDTSESDYSSSDQLYLMSFDDMTNGHFGFAGTEDTIFGIDAMEDLSRQTEATEYASFFAKWSSHDYLNGLSNCPYYLRSIKDYTNDGFAKYYYVECDDSGYISDRFGDVNSDNGIRPAFRISKNAQIPI